MSQLEATINFFFFKKTKSYEVALTISLTLSFQVLVAVSFHKCCSNLNDYLQLLYFCIFLLSFLCFCFRFGLFSDSFQMQIDCLGERKTFRSFQCYFQSLITLVWSALVTFFRGSEQKYEHKQDFLKDVHSHMQTSQVSINTWQVIKANQTKVTKPKTEDFSIFFALFQFDLS